MHAPSRAPPSPGEAAPPWRGVDATGNRPWGTRTEKSEPRPGTLAGTAAEATADSATGAEVVTADAQVSRDAKPVAAGSAEPPREVVTRVSTSDGRHWGVNVGRYPNAFKARQVLLQTALSEMSTLDGSLRKVVRRPTGFDANFMGMTREAADLACRRLHARQITCFMIGPG